MILYTCTNQKCKDTKKLQVVSYPTPEAGLYEMMQVFFVQFCRLFEKKVLPL